MRDVIKKSTDISTLIKGLRKELERYVFASRLCVVCNVSYFLIIDDVFALVIFCSELALVHDPRAAAATDNSELERLRRDNNDNDNDDVGLVVAPTSSQAQRLVVVVANVELASHRRRDAELAAVAARRKAR